MAATVSYDATTRTATLDPSAGLAAGTTYTATVSGAKDAAGNTMNAVSWNFTTAQPAQPATLAFGPSSYSVNEGGGSATVTVTRSGDTTSAVSVNYATSNGTAAAGSDYSAASGTLSFAAGQTSRTFSVAILNDSLVEGNETLNLALSNPSSGAVLGTSTAILTIVDNDTPDTTAPTVMSETPAPNATGISTGTAIKATFSESMDPATVTGATFQLVMPSSGGLAPRQRPERHGEL